jgi:hypothetical protein
MRLVTSPGQTQAVVPMWFVFDGMHMCKSESVRALDNGAFCDEP